jgi:hypothetical protein
MASQASNPLLDPRIAAIGLRVSGVIGGVGAVFLVGMYAAFASGARNAGMTLGWINDVTGVVTLPLALPAMLSLHRRIRPDAGRSGDALLVLGVGSSAAISFLQLLLVTGVLTFEQEIGPVMVAYLGLGTWFVATGRIARRRGILRGGTRLGIGAALYLGYPVWAFRLARALETEAASPAGQGAMIEPATA